MAFIKFFQRKIQLRKMENLSCFNYDIALKHFENFINVREIEFNGISKQLLFEFQRYLSSTTGIRCHKKLSHNSANSYFSIVLSVVREAANQRLVEHGLLSGITTTKRESARNATLTIEELQMLAETPYRLPDLKNAFLLSCLTGLQWSEIVKLKWKHIEFSETCWFVDVGRDDGPIPLSEQARDLLGVQRNSDSLIFNLHYTAALCVNLNQWALRAGVYRNITFNIARQTFGKILLDNDVPIELVSELLGHKQLKTTQKLYGTKANSMTRNQLALRTFSI